MNVIPLHSLARLPLDRPVLIYGSGRGGRLIARAIRLTTELTLTGFVDTFQAGSVDDTPVHCLSDLAISTLSQATLIVASSYFEEILGRIRQLALASCYDARPMFAFFHRYDLSLDDGNFVELFELTLEVFRRFAPDLEIPAQPRFVQVKCL